MYEVRRAFRARDDDMMKMANAVRSAVRLGGGNRAEVLDALTGYARSLGATVESDGAHRRVWLHRRNLYYPCVEATLTVVPDVVPDKIGPGFDEAWAEGLKGPRQLEIAA
ncbi:hypothetical protein [Nonomuraea sp. NPDC052265]|uniref:hypothetical protein n=1 Tax=Nonomuraea sp. NPDC052265 TaxID=3364374 RepID=UPI0037C676DC